MIPNMSDTVTLTENIVLNITTGSLLFESVTVTEDVSLTVVAKVAVSDTVTVSENMSFDAIIWTYGLPESRPMGTTIEQRLSVGGGL